MKVRNRLRLTYASQSKSAFLDLHVFVNCGVNFDNFIVNFGTCEERFAVFK